MDSEIFIKGNCNARPGYKNDEIMLAHTSGLRVQDHGDAAAMVATGSARMRLSSLIRALRATQCQILRLEDAMFAVVEHVILLRLTSPGNGWKQKCLPALQIQAWPFQKTFARDQRLITLV
jgi:hypothetical protein